MPSVLDESGNERSIGSTAKLYITIGIRHILPDGLDHILFVLAIFLASVRFRALLIQVSAFTVASRRSVRLRPGAWHGVRRVLQDPTGARQYRRFVVLPSSALIGFVGFWWAVVRFIP